MKAHIRLATTRDAAAACHVLRRSITECCVDDHHNTPEVLAAWLRNKTPENVTRWFTAPENFPLVAVLEQHVVGVGLLTAQGELALCYILPEVRFTGTGKALLHALESHAQQRGLTQIHLSSTATANMFYQRNGFTPNGTAEIEFGIPAFPLVKQISTV
ncbi:MAG: GNAT family N-acetyltransferase [Gammaproteobacteria bacterium]|nr:GNAT family N-acetyltransferase [Gammaproteobacteria bacterium]